MTLKDASCQNLKGETDITNCTYGFEIVCNKIVCLRVSWICVESQ